MFDWWLPVQALWLMLPAYVANMAPVVLAKALPEWNAPMDGGRTRADGSRVLGAGKTWRGLIGGSLVAAVVALLQSRYLLFSPRLTDFGVTETGHALAPLWLGLALGFGALVGDAVKSYFKRKSGRPRGAPWVGPDQLDFVVGGLLLVALVGAILPGAPFASSWTYAWFVTLWPIPLILIVATPALHWLVNVIGYKLGLKSVPW